MTGVDLKLKLDGPTAEELGVRTFGARGGELLELLNSTSTSGGRRVLAGLVAEPLGDAQAIRARQRAIRAIGAVLAETDLPSLGAVVTRVEGYVDSTIVPLPSGRLGEGIVRLRYPTHVDAVVSGLEGTRALLRYAERVGAVLSRLDAASPELAAVAAQLRGAADHEVLRKVAASDDREFKERRISRLDAGVRTPPTVSALRATLQGLYNFDALRSLARASMRPGFTFPAIVEDGPPSFLARGLFHPMLQRPVPSDCRLGDDVRVVYMTGPNMGGKSTLLRSAAIAVLLAHIGMAVPAAELQTSVFDRVFVAMTVRDDVRRGESFYLAEVRRVHELVRYVRSGERVFAVIDEPFRGTNVLDAEEATALVVEGLARAERVVLVVASHLAELGERLRETPHLSLQRMGARVDGERVDFTFRLEPGVSTIRLGMRLLDREGVRRDLESL